MAKGNGQSGHGGRFVCVYPDIPYVPQEFSDEQIAKLEEEGRKADNPEHMEKLMNNFWNAFGGGLKNDKR